MRVDLEPRHPYFLKIRAALVAPVQLGIIIEADSLIWNGADLLFPSLERETVGSNYTFPLLTRHPDRRLPMNHPRRTRKDGPNHYQYPVANRSFAYGHAHMSWSYLSLPFLAKVYTKVLKGQFSNDEEALNDMLWDSNATKQFCMYDPFW